MEPCRSSDSGLNPGLGVVDLIISLKTHVLKRHEEPKDNFHENFFKKNYRRYEKDSSVEFHLHFQRKP